MDTSLRIDLGLIATRNVGELSAFENMEIVVCCVTTGMAFCADCSA